MWILNPSYGVSCSVSICSARPRSVSLFTPKPVMSQRCHSDWALRVLRPLVQRSSSARIKGASASVGDLCVTGRHIEQTTFKNDSEREREIEREKERGRYKENKRATQAGKKVRKLT
ncbi:hypothetical protein QQF64_003575 [Cirrhinus molitorella]|uniref:Uncharacterized protein n=1 Tax=Cirrhinus molitorella TaxID=172907 RepID=A0ABR3MLP4_9TELE